ncbi:MAG: iron ABC transporter permease [Saprospirales bacterium]|nr:MAG: iron ABC transporter permease [Saprospirales bacterium]
MRLDVISNKDQISTIKRGLYWRLFRVVNPWTIFAFICAALIATPLITILYYLIEGPSDTWHHLAETVLLNYLVNSVILVFGVSTISLLLGVSTAWLVSTTRFYGRQFFEWALILPLAVPTYIVAIAYVGIFDYTGPLQNLSRNLGFEFGPNFFEIVNLQGVMVIMSFVLYPYVYVLARAWFANQSATLLESGRMLGSNPTRTFFTLALPVARPAIVAGLSLVIMEVLNDYGAVKYFGVNTLTTGIFRSWFSLGDISAAIYMCGVLMLLVFLILGLEKWQRGKAKYTENRGSGKPLQRYETTKSRKILITIWCSIPLLVGFVFPVSQLISWTISSPQSLLDLSFIRLVINSFSLAAVVSVLGIAVALLLIYSIKLYPFWLMRILGKFSTLGYSIPGAVIAVGIMIPLLFLDKGLTAWLESTLNMHLGLLLSGTLVGLIFAYIVRFLAVGYYPLESSFKKTSDSLLGASRVLGVTPVRTLRKIYLPMIKTGIFSGALLLFVDVLKELPLTLIMRPFNFNTLATRAFELASDEMVAEAAAPALVIILTGIVPIILLSKLVSRKN